MKDILAKKDKYGVSLLDMASGKGILEHVSSVIRQKLSENEVRCHFVPRIEHTMQQTTTTGGFTQDMIPVS